MVLEQEKICISSFCTNLGKWSVRHKASKIWNSFPDSLKVVDTSKQFKNKLNIYLQPAVNSCNNELCKLLLLYCVLLLLILITITTELVTCLCRCQSLYFLLFMSVLLDFVSVSVVYSCLIIIKLLCEQPVR